MELSNYIEQLLQEHDCVIVPHFGGFIANYQSATINKAIHKIVPPSKSVLFNSNLIHNDGLLGHAVSHRQNIEFPSALAFIKAEVVKWKANLEAGKRVEIGEFGFLFKSNNQIIFEQSREVNILLQAYGLTSINFVDYSNEPLAESIQEKKPLATESVIIELHPEKGIDPVVETHVDDEKIIPIQSNKNRRFLKYLGAAAAIPLMFYTYWIPMETDFIDTGKIQFADFNPIQNAPERHYQLRHSDFVVPAIETVKSWDELIEPLSEHVTIYNYQFDDQLYIPIRLDKTATSVKDEIQLENEVVQANTSLNFHVIGGCFSVKENAENLVEDLKKQGYQASIFDRKGGLYRVSAGDYVSSEMAEEKLKAFKAQGFSGWILNK